MLGLHLAFWDLSIYDPLSKQIVIIPNSNTFSYWRKTSHVPTAGCLPFVRTNRLGRLLNNGKGFSKISKPTERNGAYLLTICNSSSPNCFRLIKDCKLESLAWKFPSFFSERKKRTTSKDSLQFPNGFSGKLLFHLTFDRNFRIFFFFSKWKTPSNYLVVICFISSG